MSKSLTGMMREIFADERETINYLLEYLSDHHRTAHLRLISDVERLHRIVTEHKSSKQSA